MTKRRAVWAATLAVAWLLSGCTSTGSPTGPTGPPSGPGPVVITSFNFPESSLLAEIYAQSLEHAGIAVRREFDLGPRDIVRPALERGVVDLVPEYLGSALASADPATALHGLPAAALLADLRHVAAQWHLTVLQPSAAQDQNAFAVLPGTASRLGLRTLSDLVPAAPELVLGGATECSASELCYRGLRRVYGIAFRRFAAFDDTSQRLTALQQGVIDVEVTFTTDPQVADGSIVLLRDDKGLQPAESIVPILTDRVVRAYGARLTRALDAVSVSLDSSALTLLNWRIEAGQDIRAEAHEWLQRHGLLAS